MTLFIECVRAALAAIRANGTRSALTALGIVIGVASVITVVSLIQGLSGMISNQFAGLGSNSVSVHAKNEFKDVLRGKINFLRFEDVEQLNARVSGIRGLCPVFSPGNAEVRFGSQSTFATVMATTPSYQDVHQRYASMGRFLAESDEQNARRVAVIGEKLIETLHLPENPVGHFIQYANEWFKIVGVMEKRGEIFGISQDDYVIIPFKTGRSIIGNDKPPNIVINVSISDPDRTEQVKLQIANAMRISHRLKNTDKDDFEIQASDLLAKSFSQVSDTVTLVMGGIVGIALLVGGVGIMNIMLVSVTERTREIGICKAIGARSQDIMMQFLVEAVILSLLGGLAGLGIGYALGAGIAAMIPNFPPAHVPMWAIAVSLLFSAGVGVVFGVIPASKAAKLDPIEALRYE